MRQYRDLSGRSGVDEFETGPDFIHVRFKGNPKVYRYSSPPLDQHKIEEMQVLAESGTGLATFINQNPDVRHGFTVVE